MITIEFHWRWGKLVGFNVPSIESHLHTNVGILRIEEGIPMLIWLWCAVELWLPIIVLSCKLRWWWEIRTWVVWIVVALVKLRWLL